MVFLNSVVRCASSHSQRLHVMRGPKYSACHEAKLASNVIRSSCNRVYSMLTFWVRMGRHHSSTHRSDDEDSRHHRKKHRKKSSRRHSSRKRRRYVDEDDSSSLSESSSSSKSVSGSDESSSSRYKSRKKHHKKNRSYHKKKKHHKRKSFGDEKQSMDKDSSVDVCDPRAVDLSKALLALFTSHPAMASELPLMLARMGSGTSFDLRQVQIPLLRQQLNDVFVCLSFAQVQLNDTGSWIWNHPNIKASQHKDDLTLLKIVNTLLESLGYSFEKIELFQKENNNKSDEQKKVRNIDEQNPGAQNITEKSEVEQRKRRKNAARGLRSIIALFKRYTSLGLTPNEVSDMLQMVAEGESVIVDEVDNDDLKSDLKALFVACGIIEEETEDGALGFALPMKNDPAFHDAYERVQVLIEACAKLQANSDNEGSRLNFQPILDMIPFVGPSKTSTDTTDITMEDDSDADSDFDGPVVGDLNSRKAILDKHDVIALADLRKKQFDQALGRVSDNNNSATGVREEWMTTPGEHDFLSTLTSEKAQMKSRTFKNEKVRGQTVSEPTSQVNPVLQAEMEKLVAEHAAARGPALIDIHREKKEKEREEKSGEWKWSRNNDLDSGRRVDKNALHMIMGGASDNLKEKFQGSVSRSFM